MTPEDDTRSEADVAQALRAGCVTFMGLELEVERGALVPRTETELLARYAIERIGAMTSPAPRVIDMCCGAGNLACAIAHHVPQARVWASDLTAVCVDLTRRNVARHGLGERVAVHAGDLFASLSALGLESSIDVVVCNPPYISEKALAAERAELLALEPLEAFAAGPYGIGIHQRVIRDAAEFLRPGGVLLMEVGLGQHRQVEMLFRRARVYENIGVRENDAGEARVVFAERSGATNTKGESS